MVTLLFDNIGLLGTYQHIKEGHNADPLVCGSLSQPKARGDTLRRVENCPTGRCTHKWRDNHPSTYCHPLGIRIVTATTTTTGT
jgi:hypothetical protein